GPKLFEQAFDGLVPTRVGAGGQGHAPALAAMNEDGRGVDKEAIGAPLFGAAENAWCFRVAVKGAVVKVDGESPGGPGGDTRKKAMEGIAQTRLQLPQGGQIGVESLPRGLVREAKVKVAHDGRDGSTQRGREQDQMDQDLDGYASSK